MTKRSSRKRSAPPAPGSATLDPVVPAPKGLSVKFVLTSLAATLNLSAAMVGLGFPEGFPALAAKPIMLTLFAVGIGLEVWAIRQLLATRRTQIAAGQR